MGNLRPFGSTCYQPRFPFFLRNSVRSTKEPRGQTSPVAAASPCTSSGARPCDSTQSRHCGTRKDQTGHASIAPMTMPSNVPGRPLTKYPIQAARTIVIKTGTVTVRWPRITASIGLGGFIENRTKLQSGASGHLNISTAVICPCAIAGGPLPTCELPAAGRTRSRISQKTSWLPTAPTNLRNHTPPHPSVLIRPHCFSERKPSSMRLSN